MIFNKFKNGFTLAEVLITLVIIGVVAALTISAVINTYVERSTISKVKKGLSTLAQAKKLAEVQNGSIEGWNFGEGATAETAAQFWNYLKPHISVARDCGSGQECYQINNLYRLDNSLFGNVNTNNKFYKFVLNDGGVMFFRTSDEGKCSYREGGIDNACAVFYYDVNGDKKPNTLGRDVFAYIMDADGVYPDILDDCTKNRNGWGCAAYIIKNNNMNYLH